MNQTQKRYLITIFIIALLSLFIQELWGNTLTTGKVAQVKDGDTVVIEPLEGGHFFTCRLYGIDAPEIAHHSKPGQPYGEEAKTELKRLVLGQVVYVETTGVKTYNREVCILRIKITQPTYPPLSYDININLEMVRRGYAWAYKKYLKRPYISEYIEAEKEAREKRLGLWQQANPQPPWEFRRNVKAF